MERLRGVASAPGEQDVQPPEAAADMERGLTEPDYAPPVLPGSVHDEIDSNGTFKYLATEKAATFAPEVIDRHRSESSNFSHSEGWSRSEGGLTNKCLSSTWRSLLNITGQQSLYHEGSSCNGNSTSGLQLNGTARSHFALPGALQADRGSMQVGEASSEDRSRPSRRSNSTLGGKDHVTLSSSLRRKVRGSSNKRRTMSGGIGSNKGDRSSDGGEASERLAFFRRYSRARTERLMSFAGCQHLLRGSNLRSILARGGQIFAGSSGSCDTYGLSEEVESLDAFLSHNWSVPRYQKFLSLTLYYNFSLAVAVPILMLVALGVLGCLGWIPRMGEDEPGFLAELVFTPFFLLTLFFVRNVPGFPFRDPVVFLDKTCINQESPVHVRQGVEKLAAFLRNSSEMVALYTDVYLLKLWTVYEVAAFLALGHPIKRMKVLPTMQAMIFFLAVSVFYFVSLVGMALHTLTRTYVATVGGIPLSVGYFVMMRWWARERKTIDTRLSAFTVKNCICAVEDDRHLVYGNIAALMCEMDESLMGCQTSVILERFDALVREQLPSAFDLSLGQYALPYRNMVWIAFGFCAPRSIDQLVRLAHADYGLREFVAMYVLRWIPFVLFLGPMWLLSLEWTARKYLHLRGCREVAWMSLSFLVLVNICLVLAYFWNDLSSRAKTDDLCLAGLIFGDVVSVICSVVVFRFSALAKWGRKRRARRFTISRTVEPIAVPGEETEETTTRTEETTRTLETTETTRTAETTKDASSR